MKGKTGNSLAWSLEGVLYKYPVLVAHCSHRLGRKTVVVVKVEARDEDEST